MAQVVLTAIGGSIGGPIGAFVGATIGRTIDNRVIASLSPTRQVGPRLAADFPGGVGEGARIAVAQWGEGYGWGAEAELRL